MLERILGPLAAKWAWLATVLRVQERFGAVRGNYLASAVTLNLFTSLFPALLVAFAVLGFFTNRDSSIVSRIIETLGVTGTNRENITTILDTAASSPKANSVVGLAGLLWTGLGVVAAIDYAIDATWQHTGRGIKDRLKGVAWGAGALLIVGVSSGVTAVASFISDGIILTILGVLVAVALNFVFWLWTFSFLSNQNITRKAYVPGAIFAAVALEIIKQLAGPLSSLLGGASGLYQGLGTAFAILAALLLLGRVLIYASILNVILWEDDHGTVTVDIEIPKVPGEVPVDADRSGAVEP